MDVCGRIPEFAQQSPCSWVSTFQINLFSSQTAWEEQGLAKSSKLKKNPCKNLAPEQHLQGLKVSYGFREIWQKLKSTCRKPLPGSNGGIRSGEEKPHTEDTRGNLRQSKRPRSQAHMSGGVDQHRSSAATAASSPLEKGPKPVPHLQKGMRNNLLRSAKNLL